MIEHILKAWPGYLLIFSLPPIFGFFYQISWIGYNNRAKGLALDAAGAEKCGPLMLMVDRGRLVALGGVFALFGLVFGVYIVAEAFFRHLF